MRLRVNVTKYGGNIPLKVNKSGWVDLYNSEDTYIEQKGIFKIIKLGISMDIPRGYEAIIAPKESSAKLFNILQTNSIGIVGNSEYGEWGMPIITLGKCNLPKGHPVCQCRIQLAHNATVWQKIKWLFYKGIKFKEYANEI